MKKNIIETDYAINDFVDVTFFDSGTIKNCVVVAFKLLQGGGHVYDLLAPTYKDDYGQHYQKLYNVPTGIIQPKN